MPVGNTIVNYRDLTEPFPNKQAMLAKASDAANQVIPDPARATARVAALSTGLDELQAVQRNLPNVMHTPRNVTASQLQSHIASNAVQRNKLESFVLKAEQFIVEGFRVKFSADDWFEWMLSFFTWIDGIVKADLPPAPTDPDPVAKSFAMAVVGDWGTGLYGAPYCAQTIQKEGDYNLLLHLGDVYYSGLPEEMQDRFFALWPKLPNAVSRSMNGNHEMYTGGHGYFKNLLPGLKQSSSYFALQNDFWTLVVLDTAYDQLPGGQEGNLKDPQLTWLRKIVAEAGNRKIVLFTHHQPFTLLDPNNGDTVWQAAAEFLQSGKIFAWYWGHEHRCLLYDPHPKFGFHGRCVGHGGFPEFKADLGNAPVANDIADCWRRLPGKADVPGGLVLSMPNIYIPGYETQFEPHGYMRLDFSDAQLNERVVSPQGAVIFDRQLA